MMKTYLPIIFSLLALSTTAMPVAADDFSIKMVEIPAGYFYMGSRALGEDFDEAPVHKVTLNQPFRMSATEITNAQYEEIFPEHRQLRGKGGLSADDNEAVVNVSYNDAIEFCRRLSLREGRTFRLPTEAEWEYACRAGSYTLYNTGDWFPDSCQKVQRTSRDLGYVSLAVAQFAPNAFGLYDMHGNVEEWCLDYYGLYTAGEQTNPCGPTHGEYRVTRGGSHHTPVRYLRSANRSAMLPDDRHSQTGFRIVESVAELTTSCEAWTAPAARTDIAQTHYIWGAPSNEPLYIPPVPYVIAPDCGSGTPFYRHNHQPAVTWCDNGDLLAIWFSADEESGRELTVLCSRLHPGANEWEKATEFFRVPDRNVTGSSLLNLGNGTLLHINGVANSGDWQNLALAARRSHDNGATWSAPELVEPEHAKRHQVIACSLISREGWILQTCDAGPGGNDGTSLHISRDGGSTWEDQWDGSDLPQFEESTTGTTIAGIHASVVQLADGSLMALGRGNSITGKDGKPHMPMSISHDMGKTWSYHASDLPPINGGQRLVLRRLNEGPLLLVSFTDHPQRTPEAERGMEFTAADGTTFTGYGMYAALSFDEGATWSVRKLITDAEPRFNDGGAWTGFFESDASHAEPRGYLCATQTPDNVIHLLSSRLHYRFNLPWLLKK
jgi:formylglycine-generating enzyme required for sulfatase activity